jgi:thioredoxin reductase (NADPH)
MDAQGPGGQAGTSSRIENYMGFPNGLSGQDLADRAVAQAERFGAQMVVPADVSDITCNELGGHEIYVEGKPCITSSCVILATGAAYRKLEIDLDQYVGRGLYYAATNVERVLCSKDVVAVVGAGNSAGQAAVFLAEGAKHVFLVVRGSDLRKTMSSYLASRVERSEKITVLLNSEICGAEGAAHLNSVTIIDKSTGKRITEPIRGVFVMIGAVPCTAWIPSAVERDAKGFVLTGQQLVQEKKWNYERPPFFLETSCPGVFAAGDVRSNSVKRVASAVGEGSMAVALVHQYLSLPSPTRA